MYLSLIVQNFIEKNPKEVSLRLIYLAIIKDSLKNNFKAVFELFSAKLLSSTL